MLRQLFIGDTQIQQVAANGEVSFSKCEQFLSDRELVARSRLRPDSYENSHSYTNLNSLLGSPKLEQLFSQPKIDTKKSKLQLIDRLVLVQNLGVVRVVNCAKDNSWIQVLHPKTGRKLTIYDMMSWDLINEANNKVSDGF